MKEASSARTKKKKNLAYKNYKNIRYKKTKKKLGYNQSKGNV